MNPLRITIAIVLSLALGATAWAGAPGSQNRLGELLAFCEGGAANGLACGSAEDCPNGRCQVRRDGTRRRPFQVIATLIIDDDVGEWDDAEMPTGNHAVAVMVEFVARGKRRVISQIYQNVDPSIGPAIADLANSDRNLDEELAAGALDDRGIFDDFLFQRPDSRMEEAMRKYLGTDGNLVVLRTRSLRARSRQVGNTLATTIQARLDVGITPADE